MSDSPYERVKGGRLTYRGGALATTSKNILKKKKKKTKINHEQSVDDVVVDGSGTGSKAAEVVYTIDPAKNMKYEELFPVETKKFGYDPKAKVKSVEDALEERIKKKADRYCK